jgi:hypothetical protein
VSARKLWDENLVRYVYLPRLRDRNVYISAIQEGAATADFFGYALGLEGGKYVGLSFGQRPATVLLDDAAPLVRKDIAAAAKPPPAPIIDPPPPPPPPPTDKVMRRFYGRVKLNELKVSSGAGQVAEEVIRHLTGLVDSDVEVRLEVRAKATAIPEGTVRTVSENARTLKFETFEFEED